MRLALYAASDVCFDSASRRNEHRDERRPDQRNRQRPNQRRRLVDGAHLPYGATLSQARTGICTRATAFGDDLALYGIATVSVTALAYRLFARSPFEGLCFRFVGWRAYLYFQLEVITASMIGNYVPKGGASVLQIGGGTRDLYYYPKGTIQVAVTQSSEKAGKVFGWILLATCS